MELDDLLPGALPITGSSPLADVLQGFYHRSFELRLEGELVIRAILFDHPERVLTGAGVRFFIRGNANLQHGDGGSVEQLVRADGDFRAVLAFRDERETSATGVLWAEWSPVEI